MRVLTVEDLQNAKIDPFIVELFSEYWPEGMEITPENIAQANATGIETRSLIQRLLPVEAWDIYLKTEAEAVAQHQTALASAQQRRAVSVARARRAIFPALGELAAKAGEDVAALARVPIMVSTWDRDPEQVRAPFVAALGAVDEAIRAHGAAVLGFDQEAGLAIKEADKAFADSLTAALVAIVEALPADVLRAPEERAQLAQEEPAGEGEA